MVLSDVEESSIEEVIDNVSNKIINKVQIYQKLLFSNLF